MKKVILLACGCFNPPTNMHLRMFEIARDHLHRLGICEVIGGVISPVHESYGKLDLISSTHRLQMVKLSLENNDWIKLSEWECKQETWSRTRQVLQYHQNKINAVLHPSENFDEFDYNWMPEKVKDCICDVQVKLLCGADLLESFGTPGLWANEDIETIVGYHGLIVISRCKTNPLEFIYKSDVLTKYMSNIVIVTEWIRNEVSSSKIRVALKRGESVRYLIPDKVIQYIYTNCLYGSKNNNKCLKSNISLNILTPSPSDVLMDSPTSPFSNCMMICNNSLFSSTPTIQYNDKLSIDTIDVAQKNINNSKLKHPGQAVKILTTTKERKLINNFIDKEVRNHLSTSKSFNNVNKIDIDDDNNKLKKTKFQLKECKSCDENLVKFIFTKHGIKIISDVETIV